MPSKTTSLALLAALTACNLTHAEIVEIPPEEMTEEYIRDTTILVPGKTTQTKDNKKLMVVRVSPIEDDYQDADALPNDLALISLSDELTYEDQTTQQQFILNSQTAQVPDGSFDPNRAANEDFLRRILGLADGAPIDYDNLQFVGNGLTSANGSNLLVSPNQFQLIIQNSGQYPTESFTTPNGEIGIEITPNNINIQVNLPPGT